MSRIRLLGALVVVTSLASTDARSDSIDLWYFLAPVSPSWPPWLIGLAVGAGLFVNYLVNFVFIGIPVRWLQPIIGPRVPFDLIIMTMIAQVVDRVGLLAGLIIGVNMATSHGMSGGRSVLLPSLIWSFGITGLGLGGVVWYFSTKHWKLTTRTKLLLAAVAGVFTNPVWLMYLPLMELPFGDGTAQLPP